MHPFPEYVGKNDTYLQVSFFCVPLQREIPFNLHDTARII